MKTESIRIKFSECRNVINMLNSHVRGYALKKKKKKICENKAQCSVLISKIFSHLFFIGILPVFSFLHCVVF